MENFKDTWELKKRVRRAMPVSAGVIGEKKMKAICRDKTNAIYSKGTHIAILL